MQIDVSDILAQGEGSQTTFTVEGEESQLEGVKLTSPISGEVRLIGTKDGVLVTGQLASAVELECDRCLRSFEHSLNFPLSAEFTDAPSEDQFLIDKHGKIDIAEPARQELEVHLPLQRLCQDDCRGIE